MKAEFTVPINKNRKPLHTLLPLKTPLVVYIDPSTLCNFSCEFCYNNTEYKKQVDAKVMDFGLFEKIVRDLKEFESPINVIHLYGYGEPLLNKNFEKMVQTLKSEKVAKSVAVTTNASLLTKERVETIVECGLDKIEISIYGLTNEAYKKFSHQKVNFDDLVQNIKYLYEKKKDCHLHIKINGNYYSEEEKQRFLDLFGNHCDSIFIDTATNIWPAIDIFNGSLVQENRHIYDMPVSEDTICPDIFYKLMIHSNGNVGLCCVDYLQTINLGNVSNKSLLDIWNSNELNELRLDHLNNNLCDYRFCSICNYPKYAGTIRLNEYKESLVEKYQSVKVPL